MTIYEYCKKRLLDNGMWEKQATAVMDIAVAENDTMAGVWSDNIDDYPLAMQAVLILMLNRHALEWIDENLPLAWYRPMFEVQS